MPINSTLDVLINTADITVLGPPVAIEIEVDRGATGPRGTMTFYGAVDPNTLTPSEFDDIHGETPVYGDSYIRTESGANYGKFYTYSYAPGGDTWIVSLSLQTVLAELFTYQNLSFTASAGGTGITSYTIGDMLYASASATLSKLPIGTANYVLGSTGTQPTWVAATGTGDVIRSISPTLTTPIFNSVSSTANSSAATGWANITTGSISIGNGLTTGALNLATSGTGATAISIGHANSTLTFVGNASLAGNLVQSSGSASFSGLVLTTGSASASAGIRLPHGTAPASPVNGDIWTTTTGLYAHINGTTVGPYSTGGSSDISPADFFLMV